MEVIRVKGLNAGPRPYAEATTGTQNISTNTFTTADLSTAVRDNGATMTTGAMVDLTNNVIKLNRAGLWFVTGTITWGADTVWINGYRQTFVALDAFGPTVGSENLNNTIAGISTSIVQSCGGLVNVGTNTGYNVYCQGYHNSSAATLTFTTTLRAIWLSPPN